MDRARFAAAWPKIRERAKGQWSRLTDEDLDKVQGSPELLVGLIQEKYDESEQAITLQLRQFLRREDHVN